MRFWHNPYKKAQDISLEILIRLAARANPAADPIQTEQNIRKIIGQYGHKIDPYILPQPSGWHALGVRFGPRAQDYLSFCAEKGPELDSFINR